jgi:nitrilase
VASPIRGRADELKRCFTAIITPQGDLLGEPLRSGEGEVIGDLDFALIDKRKAFMDSSGH